MKIRKFWSGVCFLICMLFSIIAFSNKNHESSVSDNAITAEVKAKISQDPDFAALHLEGKTENGVVILMGNVNSNTEADKIIELVESIKGVKDVDTSRLRIEGSEEPISDAAITAKVKGKFIQEKLFGDKDISAMTINVETNNRIVYLSGVADNEKQAKNAEKIAKSVTGVTRVYSKIKIKP